MALKRSLAGDVPLRRSNPDPVYFQTNIIGPFIRGKTRREQYHLYEHVLSNKMRLS